MPGDKRTPMQTARDRAAIAELNCKGWTQQKIANYMELSTPTVCREIKAIKKAWAAATLDSHGELVSMELNRLRMVESEYWLAWEKSQADQTTVTETDEASVEAQMNFALGNSGTKTSRRTQTSAGNPQFLGGVVKVIETRCKLLGLFPDGTAPRGGGQIQINDNQLEVLGQLMRESQNQNG
jgi:hypothetical protein